MEQLRRSFGLRCMLGWIGMLAPIGGCVGGDHDDAPGERVEVTDQALSTPPNRILAMRGSGVTTQFISLDPATGAITVISSLPETVLMGESGAASGYDPARHRYTYLAHDEVDQRLVTVDVLSGATLADVVVQNVIGDIAIDPSSGDVLCLTSSNEDGRTIDRVDPMTGAMTVTASSPPPSPFVGEPVTALGEDAVYYKVRSGSPAALISINAFTGEWSNVPLSPSPSKIFDVQYDFAGTGTHRLFAIGREGTSTEVLSISRTTGFTTAIKWIGGLDGLERNAAAFDPVGHRYFFIARPQNPAGGSGLSPYRMIVTVDTSTGVTGGASSPTIDGEWVYNLQYERTTPTPPPSGLVINEIDYDQLGVDTTEYVEIYNGSGVDIDLPGYELVFVNGANNSIYTTVDLGVAGTLEAGQYLVVGSDAALVAVPESAKTISLGAGHDYLQNGSPDGMAIVDTYWGTVSDAVSYEGPIPAARIPSTGVVSLVEGTAIPTGLADSNSVDGSLCRQPDGVDTNDASSDWALCTTLTPGAPNL